MQKGCCHSAAAAPFHNGHRNGHLVGMTGAKEPKNFNQSLMAMNESTDTGTNITWPVILFFPFSFSRLLCRHLTNSLDCTVVVLTLFFFPSHTHWLATSILITFWNTTSVHTGTGTESACHLLAREHYGANYLMSRHDLLLHPPSEEGKWGLLHCLHFSHFSASLLPNIDIMHVWDVKRRRRRRKRGISYTKKRLASPDF